MELAPGALVTPDVELVRPLNAGAMGSLWVGQHVRLDRPVAIKFIAEKLAGDAGALARFQREARAAAQLQSPHVVRTYDYGMTDDRWPYIVMELLEGETLGARLRRGWRLAVDDTVRLVAHVAEALAEAHQRGIVHRDIKPDNIFLVATAGPLFAKVLDFGMAKQATTRGGSIVTATGVIVGTPEYMSPEQVLGSKQVDHRADLWALGVVTYRVLFGDLPFTHDTPHGLIFAICEGQFPAPSSRGAPAALDGWFARALAPQLEQRFATGGELAAAFSRAVTEAGAGMAKVGRTVVGAAPHEAILAHLTEAPTVATALSVRSPSVPPEPPRGAMPLAGGGAEDPATLESATPQALMRRRAAAGPDGDGELDGDTVRSARPSSPALFTPSATADGHTLESHAPVGPVRLRPPESLRTAGERVSVELGSARAGPSSPPPAVPAPRPPPRRAGLPPPTAPTPPALLPTPRAAEGSLPPASVAEAAPPARRGSAMASWPDLSPPTGGARPLLPTLLPAQELRAARARGRRLGWWLVLVLGTTLAAIGVGVILLLSPPADGTGAAVAPTEAATDRTAAGAASPPRRGQTELGRPAAAASTPGRARPAALERD